MNIEEKIDYFYAMLVPMFRDDTSESLAKSRIAFAFCNLAKKEALLASISDELAFDKFLSEVVNYGRSKTK